MKRKLALIGFGTVGQGLCEILLQKKDMLRKDYGFKWEVVAVCDINKGSLFNPKGLDVQVLLDLAGKNKSLEDYPAFAGEKNLKMGWDALKTIKKSNADIICEMSYTDIKTAQPATDHCKAALKNAKHVVTCNKGPAALYYNDLIRMAKKNKVLFKIEGTVMSGTPVLNLAQNELAGNQITAISGILNGTTNYILTKMEEGQPYEEVLKEAQRLGYAEADPTADVEGFDALAKVTILANVLMQANLKPGDIPCKGISKITLKDIEKARNAGKRWKLIGQIKRDKDGVKASVAPMMMELSHPLAGVSGATNALTFTTDLMGDVTIIGAGAGRRETGFSILSDILAIQKQKK